MYEEKNIYEYSVASGVNLEMSPDGHLPIVFMQKNILCLMRKVKNIIMYYHSWDKKVLFTANSIIDLCGIF